VYSEPLDVIPLWGLFLCASALFFGAMEGGYRLGKWRHVLVAEEKESPVSAMVASILGLLAFLLAFTFGLGATRFEERRHTVLEEANAIGTTYLRTQFLPEPERTEIARLLREYVDVRVQGVQDHRPEEVLVDSEKIQQQIWAAAVKVAEKNRDPITALFIQSLNETIDVHAKRVLVGLRSRIPLSIWAGLYALAILGMISMGYQAGLAATRRSPAMLGLVLGFAIVMLLIADLDRGFEGYLTVGQQPMIELQKSMQTSP
jgi:hypothetical protein